MNWKLPFAPEQTRNGIVFVTVLGMLVVLMFSLNALFASRSSQSEARSRLSTTQTPSSVPLYQTEDHFRQLRPIGQTAFIRKGSLWLAKEQYNAPLRIQAAASSIAGVDQVSFSPDSKKLVFHYDNNIWVGNTNGTGVRQLSKQGGIHKDGWAVNAHSGIWSPDGKLIAYIVESSGDGKGDAPRPQIKTGLWVVDIDGRKYKHLVTDVTNIFSFTPNGQEIVYKRHSTGESVLISLHSLQIEILNSSFFSGQYAYTNDGSRMAYFDKLEDDYAIVVADPNGANSKVVVKSQSVVQFPSFSPDGRYLTFVKQVTSDPTRQELWMADLVTERSRLLVADALDSHWLPSSKTIVFWRRTSDDFNAGDLFLFDLETEDEERLTFTGDIFPRFAVSR